MTAILLVFGLAAVSMLVITRPLFNKSLSLWARPHLSIPDQQRSDVLMALNELEYDYRMNKLSAEDYKAMALPYRKLAFQWLEHDQQAGKPQMPVNDQLRKALEDEIELTLQKKMKEKELK